VKASEIVEQVRARYDQAAKGQSSCCGGGACSDAATGVALKIGYTKEELQLAEDANLGLGCGAPIAQLRLQPGETVVDLGSGPGFDAFVAARAVGATGHVLGVDMTPSLLERARATAAKLGLAQVEFHGGRLESLPLADGVADAVTSNCVINLVPDKPAVFREIARVLRPGGRLAVSDIVLDRPLPESIAQDVYAWVGCVAGASLRDVYFEQLAAAGLGHVEIVKDIDYLAEIADAAPDEVQPLLARTGLKLEDVLGTVRSITYRATKD
jgi:arsenite methyltransferase